MSGTYGSDVKFLEKYSDVLSLSDSRGNAVVAVVPKWQGRVLTSSATGTRGLSFGWINYEFIKAGKLHDHINVFGGEDRFWLGPEGGQFSIFFKKGTPFDLDHWHTPASIDTESFEVVRKSKNSITMKKDTRLENYSGTVFKVRIDRDVRVLELDEAIAKLPLPPGKEVNTVAYESINKISNTGKNTWDKKSGMLSIWILGMFNPSPVTTIVIPFNPGSEKKLGPLVNDAYFGKVPADRLVCGKNAVFFSGDGQYRSKIGLTPQRAKPVIGSYDAASKSLTIVQYTKPDGASDYVNSMWEVQKDPYKGDVINSYNDGAPKPGAKPLGPFYELETSSPAAALAPGQSLTHVNRTFHFVGPEESLDKIALAVLGTGLKEINGALRK
ncbi:MAG: DUF6786 family protein [bacterium]